MGPSRGPEIYVLTSIAGVPIDPSLNLYAVLSPDYAAVGAELMILGDTLIFYADGRGEERNQVRWRAQVSMRRTPDDPSAVSAHQHDFVYFEVGHLIVSVHDVSSRPKQLVHRRVGRDALEVDGQWGAWRFERAIGVGAP